jgi:hypothetical protein
MKMSNAKAPTGERVHPKQPFFVKRRSGEGKEIDFAYEAFGPHGGPNELRELEELRSNAGAASGIFVESNLPALRQQSCAGLRENLHGQIVQEASYMSGIHINRRFIWGNENRFSLAINALQEGEIEFSTAQTGVVGGSLNVTLNARLNGFRYEQSCAAGGFGKKTVKVDAAFTGKLCVIVGGYANFADFDVRIFGAEKGQVEVATLGKPTGKMLNRILRFVDTISYGDTPEQNSRVIAISDEAAS